MSYKSLLLIGLIILSAVILFLFNPQVSAFYPTCPLNEYTGLYCPGCGTQRAAHEILHGNIIQAFGLNALFTLSVPFAIYYTFVEFFNRLAKTDLKNIELSNRSISILLIIAGLFMILRNLNFPPFNWLAP